MDNDFEITGSFFSYGSKINFPHEKLEMFRNDFGQIGLFCRTWCYSPKSKPNKHYSLKIEKYQNYYEAIEKSLNEKKDCLYELVKDNNFEINVNNKVWY